MEPLQATLGLTRQHVAEIEDLLANMLDNLERVAGVMERFEDVMNPTLGGGGRVGAPPAAARHLHRRGPS